MILNEKQQEEFKKAAKPLVEWLIKNCHPHVTAIVDPYSVELVEGIYKTPIEE